MSSWWRHAAIYQIYIRSFADGNGDGVGDLAGLRSRLHYLRDLGVDAIWINPWYSSPMADGGYDVADYRGIDALFGDLAAAEDLIADAHRYDLRVIIDLVPNHCSTAHPWFQAAIAAGPGSAQRQRFWFRSGRGAGGELPPNDWPSVFGGPAWTRITEPDGTDGQWYLHLFDPAQPDFNWEHPDVRAEFADILRFWLDRGVDGFRIDAADRLSKHPDLPDLSSLAAGAPSPYTDQDAVHEIYRSWRRIVESYAGDRVLIGEVWFVDPERFTRYLRSDELHSAFNFDFLCSPWDAKRLRKVIEDTISWHAKVDAPPTWVLSNHDVTRHVTRYGRADTGFAIDEPRAGNITVDLAVGTRRARAAALLTMALPGVVYVYQGDELGLWEVEDIPESELTDPTWRRSAHTDRGRDGCRVPLPWYGTNSSLGFSSVATARGPWLPQPARWRDMSVDVQLNDPTSMYYLYRNALVLRRNEMATTEGASMVWLPAPDGVLAFSGSYGFVCVVNIAADPIPISPRHTILLTSAEVSGVLPRDTAVWLHTIDSAGVVDGSAPWSLS